MTINAPEVGPNDSIKPFIEVTQGNEAKEAKSSQQGRVENLALPSIQSTGKGRSLHEAFLRENPTIEMKVHRWEYVKTEGKSHKMIKVTCEGSISQSLDALEKGDKLFERGKKLSFDIKTNTVRVVNRASLPGRKGYTNDTHDGYRAMLSLIRAAVGPTFEEKEAQVKRLHETKFGQEAIKVMESKDRLMAKQIEKSSWDGGEGARALKGWMQTMPKRHPKQPPPEGSNRNGTTSPHEKR